MTQITTTYVSAPRVRRLQAPAGIAARYVLHFAEMWLAMMAGMLLFHMLPLGLDHTTAAVLALVALGAASVLPWLAQADGAAMLLGMLGAMLLRPHHYAHSHGSKPSNDSVSSPTDPVCGMAVEPLTAKYAADYEGQTYFFCAPGCRKAFVADPQPFLVPDFTPSL